MLGKTLFTMLAGGVLVVSIVKCGNAPATSPQQPDNRPDSTQSVSLVDRGAYLVTMMGCNDCHSNKIMTPQGPMLDSANLLAGCLSKDPIPPYEADIIKKGYAVFTPSLTVGMGPWGTTFAANLTPDSTGIGSWTIDQFKKALREGKYKGLEGTRPLMPPMPWQNFSKLHDEDVEAIFAYLKSIKPVKNVVPAFRPTS